jgi:hypothetical protein
MVALHQCDRYLRATVRRRSVPRTLQFHAYGSSMSETRYGRSGPSAGTQDQGERKDEGWQSRQGGRQSRPEGHDPKRGVPSAAGDANAPRAEAPGAEAPDSPSGTDQPPRMGGPLGPDPDDPHLPEGAQNNDTRGSGAGGFDRGVDATNIGAVHQGVRPEDSPDR